MLFRRNGEIVELGALPLHVEGQCFRGRAATGIFHVVDLARGGSEGLAGLQGFL